MATYKKLAPELSKIFTADQAKEMADKVLVHAKPKPIANGTIEDLEPKDVAELGQYVLWFGRRVRPLKTSKYINWPPKRVAAKFGMSRGYVEELLKQRDAVINAVSQWGDGAFDEVHPKPIVEPVPIEEPKTPKADKVDPKENS